MFQIIIKSMPMHHLRAANVIQGIQLIFYNYFDLHVWHWRFSSVFRCPCRVMAAYPFCESVQNHNAIDANTIPNRDSIRYTSW